MLSRTQAGPGRTVKQEQEEISRKHVQTFIYPSVYNMERQFGLLLLLPESGDKSINRSMGRRLLFGLLSLLATTCGAVMGRRSGGWPIALGRSHVPLGLEEEEESRVRLQNSHFPSGGSNQKSWDKIAIFDLDLKDLLIDLNLFGDLDHQW